MHFQKRIDKIFSLMKNDFFKGSTNSYHVSSYFFRIEFQQRGAPHVHSLLWMKNKDKEDAPNFCFIPKDSELDASTSEQNHLEDIDNIEDQIKNRMNEDKKFEDFLISTNADDIKCDVHENKINDFSTCEKNDELKAKIEKYQTHKHTFTCAKKRKTMTIKESEGHGRLDGQVKGPALSNISVCIFTFPKFPLDETKLIAGIPKEMDDDLVKQYKSDLSKIIKYLVRLLILKILTIRVKVF